MRISSVTWPKLALAFGCETTLSVTARARKATGSSSKNGSLAGLECGGRDEEDQLELLKCTHDWAT